MDSSRISNSGVIRSYDLEAFAKLGHKMIQITSGFIQTIPLDRKVSVLILSIQKFATMVSVVFEAFDTTDPTLRCSEQTILDQRPQSKVMLWTDGALAILK